MLALLLGLLLLPSLKVCCGLTRQALLRHKSLRSRRAKRHARAAPRRHSVPHRAMPAASTHAASTHADVAVPPIAYDGPEEEVEAEATACYRSYGCLAAPGFRDAQYSEGRLITLTRSDAFYFEWMGDAARHVYHRLPDRPPCS